MKVIKTIFLLVHVIILSCLLVGCSGTEKLDTKQTSVYKKVLSKNEIIIGYISYPPSFIKDPNTDEFSGIFFEVMDLVAKNLDIKVKYTEELGWGTMIEALNNGRVDIVVTGIWPTSARGKQADFTVPIYYSVVRAYTKFGNNNFNGDIQSINSNKIKISTIDGEMTSIIASADFPNAQTASLSQLSDVSQVLLEVASDKADVTFVEPAIAEEYISNNPDTIQEVKDVKALRVFPNVMMVNKGEIEFLSMINIAITELINNGYVDKIIDKYEKHPNSFERVALPYRK